MLEALSAFIFWRKERRQSLIPVEIERRRMSTTRAQKHLLQAVDRLSEAVEKKCEEQRSK